MVVDCVNAVFFVRKKWLPKHGSKQLCPLCQIGDYKEGTSALSGKRKPAFKGE